MFRVEGRSIEGDRNIVEEVTARKSKEIYDNPEKHGFSKVYKVTAISERRERGEHRESKYS